MVVGVSANRVAHTSMDDIMYMTSISSKHPGTQYIFHCIFGFSLMGLELYFNGP